MKRMILMGIVIITSASIANAQTTGSNSTNGPTHSSEGSRSGKKAKKKTALNHRRNYHWKSGQQATPTGQEATGVGSGYSAIKKDTAGKRED